MLQQAIIRRMRARWLAGLTLLPAAMATPAAAQFGPPFTVAGPFTVPSAGHPVPRVAIGAAGHAAFTWGKRVDAGHVIQARSRSPMGALGPIRTLSRVDEFAGAQQIAVNAAGDALVLWGVSSEFRVEARTLSATGVLGPILTIAEDTNESSFYSRVAVDRLGNAVVVWWTFPGGVRHEVQTRTLSAAGVLGPIQTLSRAGQETLPPVVAVDANGNAVVVWAAFDSPNWRIQARRLSATGVVGRISSVAQAGPSAPQIDVGIDADGDAVVAWSRIVGGNRRVQTRTLSKAGDLGPIQTLSPAGINSVDYKVAVDRDGNAVVVWRNHNGKRWRVQARSRSLTGVLGSVETLSTLPTAYPPEIAIDRGGKAIAAWLVEADDSRDHIQARSLSTAGELGAIWSLPLPRGHLAFDPRISVSAEGDAVITYIHRAGEDRVRGVAAP